MKEVLYAINARVLYAALVGSALTIIAFFCIA